MGQTLQKLFTPKYEMKVLMVGPKGAGKTTILNKLKNGEVLPTTPTMGITFKRNNISFTVWEFGGEKKIRPYMRHFFQNTQGLIFVLDSTDRNRVVEARDELHRMLGEDELRDAVLLVCANKNDCDNAMNVVEIAEKLRLFSLKQRPLDVRSTCATTGKGLYEGLDWLSKAIVEKA